MIKRLKYSITALMLFLSLGLFAQRPEVEMADVMRSNGKIYVVVAILAIIFAVITVYLVSIDRKIGKLEKDSEK